MSTELEEAESERVEEDVDELEKLGVKLVALDTGITSQLVSYFLYVTSRTTLPYRKLN